VAGTGFERVSGIGTGNRRRLFKNGIFTAEEFSTADRESLETILSSNVNLDSLLENVNDEIEFP
jgi:predicted flap endonuclease-1-like 5' DNA nuclease